MSRSVAIRSFQSALLTGAMVLACSSAALAAAPPSAPPLIIDSTYPNLFYGVTPSNTTAAPGGGLNGPVVVFVHGLGGSYIDWIEANNCPANVIGGCKSSPNAKVLGSNNDMYDWAYQAGYRTVFMSMNADNSNNDSSIQTNAAMLESLLPTILSHFGVSKVFFVCHSKGGLDLEEVLANPMWTGIASAVVELGTPNQGDALADWCYTSAGNGVCALAGLLNPAVQSMEIANVLQLRTEWDPIFENAKIPFYTMSGNTYLCPGLPNSQCITYITGEELQLITTPPGGNPTGKCNQANTAPCEDGLVNHPETLLPTSYAMELGILPVNHYALRMGDNSFTFINGRIQDLWNEQPGFNRVATAGFGDQHNNWSWSMAWFNGMLYVGTGREPNCVTSATSAIQLQSPSLYPPSIGDCTPDYHDLPLQAEIWQYNPATNLWTNVFESENSLTTIDNSGNQVSTARDIGFRGLTLATEPGCSGPCAIYAGGVTSGEIFECHPPNITTGCVPQGSFPPPRILRSTNGVNWSPLYQNGTLSTVQGQGSVWTPCTNTTQTCFLGSLTSTGDYTTPSYPQYSIRSAAQLCSQPGPSMSCAQDGTLFFQVGDFPGVGRAFANAPGANPALGDNCGLATCFAYASPPTEQLPMWILENFNNYLYAGTGSPAITGTQQQYGVWSTDGSGTAPYTWNPIIIDGGFAANLIADFAMSMEIFTDPAYCPTGCLYVGTDRPNEMVRIHPDTTGQVAVYFGTPPTLDPNDSWDLIVGNPRTIPASQPNGNEYVAPLSGIGQYFDNGFTGHFWRMGVGSQGLYLGTWDQSTDNYFQNPTLGALWSQEYGTDLWRSPDGVNWTFVSKTGMGDGNNTGTRSSAATPFGLFMGTAREQGGTQVFNVDNGVIDFNKDGVIDARDVAMMEARLNTKAKHNDPMDLNRDGMITQKDVALLRTQCTHPNCQVPAVKPKNSTLTPPVLSSQYAQLGTTVSISWTPVTGAADYLVYRIALSPSDTQPPPAANAALAACAKPNAPSICTMLPQQKSQQQPSPALYGYPSAPEFLGRVSGTQYTETAVNALQALYFVVAEDSSGDLSSPSNVVGGPSFYRSSN